MESGDDVRLSREDADDPVRLFTLFLDRFGWEQDEKRKFACELFSDIRKSLERKEVRS
jgi:hypothetical protein